MRSVTEIRPGGGGHPAMVAALLAMVLGLLLGAAVAPVAAMPLPAVPRGVAALQQPSGAVTLSWRLPRGVRPRDVRGFRVRTSIDGGRTWVRLPKLGAKRRSLTLTGLQQATRPTVQVRVLTRRGKGSWSTVQTAVTPTPGPAAPPQAPAPTPTPPPGPTLVTTAPTAAPTTTATPTPTSTRTATPTPTPTPTPSPTSTPTRVPTPTPTSSPSPTSTPTRTPTPTPTPTSTPTQTPTSTPTQTPTSTPTQTPTGTPTPTTWWAPTKGTSWQWQLTGTIDTSVAAAVYDIDGADSSATTVAALHTKGAKVICYFSAGSYEDWRADAAAFPASVRGKALDGWAGEQWLDVRALDILLPIMERRIAACRDKGFDAVEPDNVDGYSNATGFPLTAAHQLAYNRALADLAHRYGLGIALKNDPDQVVELQSAFDFAVVEECARYDECDAYAPFTRAGKAVLHVEYVGTLGSFCPATTALGFSSMLKRLDLDAWRQPCP